jgi:tRNA(Ile)-lysidine synthase
VLVAVSGGLDSVTLLDLLALTRGRHRLDLLVAHVDHGIHPDSARVAGDVAALAEAMGLPLVTTRLALGPSTSETRARAARRQWLTGAREEVGARWIATAHQADDQLETILMRILRGSGTAGLAGMRPRDRQWLRPLLHISRRSLEAYARRRRLHWWDDPANQDAIHLRSWIRTQLLPGLTARLPDLRQRVDQTRRHAVRNRQSWNQALRHWPGLGVRLSRREQSLDWQALRSLPPTLAATLLEALIRSADGPRGSARVRRGMGALAGAPSGASVDVGLGWRLELAFGRIRVVPPASSVAVGPVRIGGAQGRARWGAWEVRWSTEPAPSTMARDGRTAWFVPGSLDVREWRRGDRVAPLGGQGSRLAVRCFQEAKVPRSQRAGWPVLEEAGHLAWIPGVCRSARLLPIPGAAALRVDVTPRA